MSKKTKMCCCSIHIDWALFYYFLSVLDFLWGGAFLALGISIYLNIITLKEYYPPQRSDLNYLSYVFMAVGGFTVLIASIYLFIMPSFRKWYLFVRGTLTSTQFFTLIYVLLIVLSFQSANQPILGVFSDQFGGYGTEQARVLQKNLQENYVIILIIVCGALFLSLWGFYFNYLFRISLATPWIEGNQNKDVMVQKAARIRPQSQQQDGPLEIQDQNNSIVLQREKRENPRHENIQPTFQTITSKNHIQSSNKLLMQHKQPLQVKGDYNYP